MVIPSRVASADLPKFIVELLAVVVVAKAWGPTWARMKVSWACEENKTQLAISSGKVSHVIAQACLRELWLVAAINSFELRAFHIPGIVAKPSNFLARIAVDIGNFNSFMHSIGDIQVKEDVISPELFTFHDI
jgi:hypothetical protein